jgi:glycerol transport system substrate-binding protein
VLTKAFEAVTGIKVNHQLLGEGEVVQAVQTQMQTEPQPVRRLCQ